MARTLSLEPRHYVLEFEREEPEESQTKWLIRPLKWKERTEIQDGMIVTEFNMVGPKTKAAQQGVMRHLTGTQNRLAVERGLLEIENLKGPDGNVLVYNQNVDAKHRESVLDSLPLEWTRELAEQILMLSGLGKEEEKN